MKRLQELCQRNYMWLGIMSAFTLAMLISIAIYFCDGKY